MKRTVMMLIALSLAACGVGVEGEEQVQTETSQQELVFVLTNHTITSPRDPSSGIATGQR